MKPSSLSPVQKVLSLALKLTALVCALWGTYLSAVGGRNAFMGGSTVFMYFTIQSNLALALLSAVGIVLLLRGRDVGKGWFVVKFVGTVAITLTGAVFCFVLAPTMGSGAWAKPNVLTHVVVPLACIADFFAVAPAAQRVSPWAALYVTLPPLAYVFYAAWGYAAGWEFGPGIHYPYFFLNWGSPAGAFGFCKGLPFMGCMWWILMLLVMLLAVGRGYLAIANALGKK